MAEVKIYNLEGNEKGSVKLSDFVFGQKVKELVVHQVYSAAMSNRRQKLAHAKDRSEVRGGGRKPWRQKGTGRARHGSIRSPLWSGGGVTFGPLKARNFKKKINRKLKSIATRMCLSDKVSNDKLIIMEQIKFDGKTKTVADVLNKLPSVGKKTAILVDKKDEKLIRSVRNIPNIEVKRVQDVNIIDLLHHQYLILDKKAVKVLEERFSEKNNK
ncbi:MAG: 50S ribosomal protein L4 [Candidatus Magasanikbacteria bacterium]|nr:50S ribosomal protein L4 [Candidatus Magasanikbacteria bacterium]